MNENQTVKTYGTYYEEKLHTATGGISPENRADEMLVRALRTRLGDSIVLYAGSSTVLYKGFRVKLNRDDYTLAARVTENGWEIPASFYKEYFGLCCDKSDAEYVTVSVLNEYPLWTDGELCILLAPGVACFANAARTDDQGYTDGSFVTRMKGFWNEPLIPEPRVNVEQTRRVISEAPYPQDIVDWRTTEYVTCYSPAITIRYENGKKMIYAANEFSRVLNWKELGTVTVIKKSEDDGETWCEVAQIQHIRWASLFVHNGDLYLSGTNGEKKAVSIIRFRDDMTYDAAHYDFGCGWTSPNTILELNGRIYQALGSSVISAPADSDLLVRENWTVSTSLKPILTKEWFLEQSGEPIANRFTVMEGNMLEGPDGNIYNIMRIESQPASGYAAILSLTPDGTEYLPVDRCSNLLRFPTSVSKFVIRRDEQTGRYFSLTSINTIKGFGDQRSILALVWSDDLFNWKIAEYLLVDREIMNPVCSAYAHSFQYVDFVIDGNDLIMAVREAKGRTNIWHDGTHITMYRVKNFRSLAK